MRALVLGMLLTAGAAEDSCIPRDVARPAEQPAQRFALEAEEILGNCCRINAVCDTKTGNLLYVTTNGITAVQGGCSKGK